MREETIRTGVVEAEVGNYPPCEGARDAWAPADRRVRLLEPAAADTVLLPHGREAPLYLVHAAHGGTFMEIPAGWIAMLVPVAGTVSAGGDHLRWELEPGQCLIWDRPLRVSGHRQRGRWFCLAGPAESWIRAGCDPAVMADILADEMDCPERQVSSLESLHLALCRDGDGDGEAVARVREAMGMLHDRQQDLRALIPRCPGRSQRRKRWSMQRLLRIRHAILAGGQGGRTSMGLLSSQVSYSRGHLARVYHAVFNETPIECAIRIRLHRARRLVEETGLAFCDIAESTGFDSQSSFSRAFKQRYGLTPTDARSRAARSP